MAIARTIDDLPEGLPPDPEPRYAHLLAEHWADQDHSLEHAVPGTRFRHSNAGACARRLAYSAAGIEITDPMDLTGVFATQVGSILHEAWQAEMGRRFGDAVEFEVTCQIPGFDGSGHIDAVVREERFADERPGHGIGSRKVGERVTAYELKTVGGYAFKAAVGKIRRGQPAEGPKREHIMQAALNGLAIGADEVVVGYMAKEALSVNVGAGLTPAQRFTAEWTFPRDLYVPVAEAEVGRVTAILELLEGQGMLAARKIPGVPGEIIDPLDGSWQRHDRDGQLIDLGKAWNCGYCPHRRACARTPAGRIPVEAAEEAAASLVEP